MNKITAKGRGANVALSGVALTIGASLSDNWLPKSVHHDHTLEAVSCTDSGSDVELTLLKASFPGAEPPNIDADSTAAGAVKITSSSTKKVDSGENPAADQGLTKNSSSLPKLLLGWASGLSIIPFLTKYTRDIKQGIVSANPTSWKIWAVNDALLLATMHGTGENYSWALQAGFAVCSFTCWQFARKYGEKKELDTTEKRCLRLAAVGWAGYLLSHAASRGSPISHDTANTLCSAIAVTVNTLGCLPSYRDFLKKPDPAKVTSDLPLRRAVWGRITPWLCATIGIALSGAALQTYSFATALQPAALFITNSLLVAGVIYNCRKYVSSNPSVGELLFSRRQTYQPQSTAQTAKDSL